MDVKNKKKFTASIVLVGDFSPLMFEPLWFLNQKIINQEEYDSIIKNNKERILIAEPLSLFETNNFSFRIESKRLIIVAKKEPFILLVDIFNKMCELLPGLSIKAFGINFTFHIPCDSMDQYKEVGYKLSPLKYWEPLFADYTDSKEKKESGLETITQLRAKPYGHISVRLEASKLIKPALYFAFNFHHEDKEKKMEFSNTMEIINECFKKHLDAAEQIASTLIERLVNK